jgi:penicillin-binding protein 2
VRSDGPRLRLGMVGVVTISLFAALFARLWYLQVLSSPEYQLQAAANQQRIIIEPAPRGRILDRNGVAIVDNRLSFVVSLDRNVLRDLDEDERATVMADLTAELVTVDPTLTPAIIEQRLASDRFSPYTPVPVAEDVPEELAVYLAENKDAFADAVRVESRAIRTYPYGRLAAHVLGYVGPINDEEYARLETSPLLYQLTDEIGKGGVEQAFESVLRGQPGRRVLEVDAEGRTIGELDYDEPVAGHDVVLGLDVRVQAIAETALREELEVARGRRTGNNPANVAQAGSVVVLDPVDGSVVAMASYPDYEPASLTDGIDEAEWTFLNDRANFIPLINRAIAGEYAPGSTFKLVSAFAGLRAGLITPEQVWVDDGVYEVPNCRGESCRFRNAGSTPHGNVDLREALTVSSDTYFYDIGARSWFGRDAYGDPIQDASTLFGLGVDTGVQLPGERSGRVMTPEEFLQRHEEYPDSFPRGTWQAGDSINLAIGQGEMLATPIQMANAYAALGNGGNVMQPAVALRVQASHSDEVIRTYDPVVSRTVPFDPAWQAAFVDGFVGVTQGEGGTAVSTFSDFPEGWVVAGKTGTAQVGTQANPRADTAIFVGMGPMPAPRYAAAAFLEESGFGGVAAAPVVARIFTPLADPTQMPEVLTNAQLVAAGLEPSPFGYGLSTPLAGASDPLAEGDVLD